MSFAKRIDTFWPGGISTFLVQKIDKAYKDFWTRSSLCVQYSVGKDPDIFILYTDAN